MYKAYQMYINRCCFFNSQVNNMAQQPNIFGGIDGRQYIALDNGCYMEVVGDQYDPLVKDSVSHDDNPEFEPVHASATATNTDSDLSKILVELQKLNARFDGMEQRVDQLVSFAANMDKFMSMKNSSTIISKTRPEPEDFEEIRELLPIMSEEEMQMLEQKLKNKQFADKLFRFFHTEYNLNGKRDGKSFFKTIVRRMVAPTLLQPFSWTGGSRKTPDNIAFTPNRSFRDTFQCLVQFVQRVVFAADMDHTSEQTDSCFSLFLRQKKVEIERFLSDNSARRAAGSRTRKSKESRSCDKATEERELEDTTGPNTFILETTSDGHCMDHDLSSGEDGDFE